MSDYIVVESSYGDPLLRTPGLTPWEARPERSSWVDFELREYPDGNRVRFERSCERWGCRGRTGDWRPAGELRAERLERELTRLRLHVALYLATSQHPGESPRPAFRDASNPSVCSETWKLYLERAAAMVPRCEPQAEEVQS